MKMKYIAFLMIIGLSLPVQGQLCTDSLLTMLDKAIQEHEVYIRQKDTRIERLKAVERTVPAVSVEMYDLHAQLYQEYKSFICDSAIVYLNRNIQLARRLPDLRRENESRLLLSYLLASTGMYKEAVDALESVDRQMLGSDLLVRYYSCYDHAYSEMGFYTQDPGMRRRYERISNTYKDSLYRVLDPASDQMLELQESSLRGQGKFDEALQMNDRRFGKSVFGTPEYAYVAFYRSLLFKGGGDVENEKNYLALSAISDIRSAIKDHASLWRLAQILYEEGDVERAYRYIRFSWDETKFYNARLRSWQSADILSLIDKTYQALIEKQNTQLELYLWCITGLLVLLVAALVYIYRQMKRLSIARNHLQTANEQLRSLNGELKEMNGCLQSTNAELTESNQIKEEYIARFIKLCSTYIDKLDAYRRMVNKKISANQTAELFKMTRSQEALDKELQELLVNFDTAFLHLFPDFVKKFNALLQEEEQIVLKKGELLNTELRIFALIRLGINDSSQIAEFLRYSVNTIYNYRAKVKNKAAVSREDFEEIVRTIR